MAGRHWQRAQRGAALLVFLVLLVMGALTWVVGNLTPETVEAARARKTADALAQARDALIGYALKHRDAQAAKDADSSGLDDRSMYGYLPLPDLGSSRNQNLDPICLDGASNPVEGCDANYFTGLNFDANGIGPTVVGRFPWRAFGIAPLRDGHGECLWLIVSGLHSRILRASPPPAMPLPPLNWDTLGQLDIVVANGTNALNSALASAHERPVAIIFAPGPALPGQDRATSATDDVSQCGGNYNAANYLDPVTAAALGGVSNYLAGTNAASGSTGDSDPANDPDVPKPMLTEGKVFASGGNYLPNACTGANCSPLANDTGLRITADSLFGALRKNANFRIDINSMLDRMVNCLRDELASGGSLANGKIAGADNHACYGEDVHPLGYYPHWREMVFVAAPATVNAASCAGALLFAGQRAAGQQRITPADRNTPANYLEGTNLTEFLAATNGFSGPDLFDRVGAGQTASQDIVRCIPVGGSFTPVGSPTLAALGFGQLVAYDPGSRTLTLGRENVVTGTVGSANAAALFGCAWTDSRPLGDGLRAYFSFRFSQLGTNVGSNGFVFALADAESVSPFACGAAGSHLGFSGHNGVTQNVAWPKIGIEFDQGRDAGFPGTAGETALNAGRNDPCGTSGCGGTAGFNSHVAILYWGNAAANAADAVTQPDYDDNVHGFPAVPPASRPPPSNPAYPSSGIAFKDLRGQTSQGGDSYLYHVRVEVTPTRMVATAAQDNITSVDTRVWILADSTAVGNQIAAMRNTTRPLSQLYPGFAPHLQDSATLHDIGTERGGCGTCQSGETCGTDNICYRQALRSLRPGFTGAQRTTDQEVRISDFFTTWIP